MIWPENRADEPNIEMTMNELGFDVMHSTFIIANFLSHFKQKDMQSGLQQVHFATKVNDPRMF